MGQKKNSMPFLHAYSPLHQSYVLLKRAQGNATAQAFLSFMGSAAAKAALRKDGFTQ